jgi:predicted DNA-binding transcriptional regulator AlpA
MARRILRPAEAQHRLGCKHSKFYAYYVGKGLIRLLRLGPNSVGVLEDELDALIDRIAAQRDIVPPKRSRGRPRRHPVDAETAKGGA